MQNNAADGANQHQEQHLRDRLELLQESGTGPSDHLSPPLRHTKDPSASPEHAGPSNGYDHLSLASQEAIQVLANKAGPDAYIHPDLRQSSDRDDGDTMMPIAAPSGHSPGASGGASEVFIAPAIANMLASSADEPPGDGRKAKRELSSSKRAAQNRAAQRAFRQRKEGYIKKLEQQVRDLRDMEHSFKTLQGENYELREYVLRLQARLLETQGDFPAPPAHLNVSNSQGSGPAPDADVDPNVGGHSAVDTTMEGGTPLEVQALAGLAAQERLAAGEERHPSPPYGTEATAEDARSTEEINRHLSAEGLDTTQPQAAT